VGVSVLISADAEWRIVRAGFPGVRFDESPLGEWFVAEIDTGGKRDTIHFFHGGYGKIAAAASTQYVIDRWNPRVLMNLGTCGGFAGHVERGAVILADRTLVYDIVERMGDTGEAIAHFATDIDLAWLPADHPQPVRRALLVSADRDLACDEIRVLRERYGAIAGDWESGAIAYVAARNRVRCLILRGVSDLVGDTGGEAYNGNIHRFHQGADEIMRALLGSLPMWLRAVR
jgi:adenosylhomocysteine nucleosidase